MQSFISEIGTIAAGIIGLAIIAVLVSGQARTAEVIREGGDAFVGAIGAAVAPVTGGGYGNLRLRP